MFEKASRIKIRFESPKGLLTIEDLWDLPLVAGDGKASLDAIAIDLHKRIEGKPIGSFVYQNVQEDPVLNLGFEIVKHIITVRLAEKDAREQAAANKEKKQKLLALIDQKQNEALSQLSIDELRKQVEAL